MVGGQPETLVELRGQRDAAIFQGAEPIFQNSQLDLGLDHVGVGRRLGPVASPGHLLLIANEFQILPGHTQC